MKDEKKVTEEVQDAKEQLKELVAEAKKIEETVEESGDEAEPVEEKVENAEEEGTEQKREGVETESEKDTTESETQPKVRTVHGQQIDLEPKKEEDEGLKFNSFKEKVEYYWDYYKWTVGVATVIALVALLLIRSVIIEMKPPQLYIAMMNAHMDSPGDATYGDDYGNERGLNPKKGRITMDVDFLHPLVIDDAALKNDTIIASMNRFTAAVTNSNVDIVITNPWVLKDYMENDVFHNLEDVYTPEELQQFEGMLTYEKNSAGDMVPVGIIINGHRNIDSFYDSSVVVVIGIPSDSKRVERAKDFIAWMLEG